MKQRKQQMVTPKAQKSWMDALVPVLLALAALALIPVYLQNTGMSFGLLLSMIGGYFSPILPPGTESGQVLPGVAKSLVALACIAGCLGWGGWVRRCFPQLSLETELATVVLHLGIGTFVFMIGLFLLGVAGLFAPVPVLAVFLAGCAGLFFGAIRGSLLREELRLADLPLLLKLSLLVTGVYVLIMFSASLVPEIFYDSLVYHIAVAQWYALTHSMHPPISLLHNFFVSGYARLFYGAGLLFSDEISAKSLHVLFMLVTTGVIYAAGRMLFNRVAGIFAALAFLTTPSIGMVGVRSAMEGFICFFEFLGLFCALAFMRTGRRALLAVSGMMLGAAIGNKYLAMMSWAAIGGALLVHAIIERRNIRTVLYDALVWNAMILAGYGAWAAYNIYYTGNPVYPALWQRFGHLQVTNFHATALLGKTISVKDVLLSPWTISMGLREEAYSGILFLLVLPLIFFTKWYRTHLKYVVMYAVLYWLMWVNVSPYFYFRYYLPALPALCLVVGYVLSEFNSAIVRLVFITVLLINTGHVALVLKNIYYPVDYLLGNVSRSDYLSSIRQTYPNTDYPAIEWINRNLPNDAVVLLQGDERAFYLKRRYVPMSISDKNYLISVLERAKNADDAARILHREGITHVLLNVPEANRLKVFDIFHFEPREYGIFLAFWDKYLKEVHRDIADITQLQRGIFSMRRQQPQWWQQYAANEANHIYVYELLTPEAAARPHDAPRNFLKDPAFFTDSRWKKLSEAVSKHP